MFAAQYCGGCDVHHQSDHGCRFPFLAMRLSMTMRPFRRTKSGRGGLANLWPNNPWYQSYLSQYGGTAYFPTLTIGGQKFWCGRPLFSGAAQL